MNWTQEEFFDRYAAHLNEQQRTAVCTLNGPVLLLAVPGSGKTTVLIHRLGYMVFCRGIDPQSILTLTYTVAATKDMTERFAAVFGEEYRDLVEFRTINGICAKIIQQYARRIGKPAFELVTEEHRTGRMLTEIMAKNMSEYPTESDVKNVRTLITYCKNMLLGEEETERLGQKEGLPLGKILTAYNSYLRENRLMDYDDQMVYALRILKSAPELLASYRERYRYICVDEAQDTSKVQHIIIGLLSGQQGNLFMVGDEDQSIYGFRAAYPEALLNFNQDHPGAQVLVMDRNYRSNASIVRAADAFIRHNSSRYEKHMASARPAGSEINYIGLRTRANQYGYLKKVAEGCSRETAVLYRDHESALPLIDLLDRGGIPYNVRNVDMSYFTHRVVADVISILRFALDPADTDLFMKIYYKCRTYLKKNEAEFLTHAAARKKISIPEALRLPAVTGAIPAGKCQAFCTNIRCMRGETPSKALFRIEMTMGYGEYMEKNSLSQGKYFILKMLANNETTIAGFLGRLEQLRELLKTKEREEDCLFTLSTVHSAKGLEYDRVYLLDVCDGVFPVKTTEGVETGEELSTLEEERRLFYVAVTRAKNELNIFRPEETPSQFIDELKGSGSAEPDKVKLKSPRPAEPDKAKKNRPVTPRVSGVMSVPEKPGLPAVSGKSGAAEKRQQTRLPEDFELIIGERVDQIRYGAGTVIDTREDADGKHVVFSVRFDSGIEKNFYFPLAFQLGMRLEKPK